MVAASQHALAADAASQGSSCADGTITADAIHCRSTVDDGRWKGTNCENRIAKRVHATGNETSAILLLTAHLVWGMV